jgi:SAM-dependent methyltransferase
MLGHERSNERRIPNLLLPLPSNDYRPHDWYQDYRGLRHLLNPTSFAAQSSKSSKQQQSTGGSFPSRDECSTLILGCGNSSFGEDMLRDGWTGKIVNVDFSSVVIEQMESKYDDAFYEGLWPGKDSATVNKMEYVCADMTQELPFSDESFDLIVCKGSFDAILCSAGSVANIRFLTEECARLLTARGVFFLVTHGNPDSRIVFLEYQNNIHYYWEGVNIQSVPRPLTQK